MIPDALRISTRGSDVLGRRFWTRALATYAEPSSPPTPCRSDSSTANGVIFRETNVPRPAWATTSCRWISHLMASRTVLREASYAVCSSTSVGSWEPRGISPLSIRLARSSAIERHFDTAMITPLARVGEANVRPRPDGKGHLSRTGHTGRLS